MEFPTDVIYELSYLYPEYIAASFGMEQDEWMAFLAYKKSLGTDEVKTGQEVGSVLSVVGGVLGTLMNLLIIAVLMSTKGCLRPSLKLVLSLAVSDVIHSSIHVVLVYYSLDTAWSTLFHNGESYILDMHPLEYALKRFLSDIFILSDLSGHVMLLVLAADIFLAVKKPLEYKSLMTKHRGNIIITVIWIMCYLPVISVTVAIEISRDNVKSSDRYKYINLTAKYRDFIDIYKYVIFGFFPILVCFYIAIIIEVKRKAVRSLSVAKQIKMTFVLGMIILTFLLGNVSFLIPALTTWYTYLVSDPKVFVFTFKVFVMINAYRGVFNSIIYSVRLPEIRKQAKMLLFKIGHRWQ